MPLRKSRPENNRHGYHVYHEVGNDVQVRVDPPDPLGMAVGLTAELELKVPKRPQGYAGCQHRDDDEDIVDHDEDEEIVGGTVDARKSPDAEKEEQD